MSGKYLFKLIIAGSVDSGKIILLRRYTMGIFTGGIKMTIGVDFSVTSCNTQYGQATLQVWDFGGEERFRSMIPSFCLGASGSIVIFDLAKQSNFIEATEWLKIIRDYTKNIPIILVGNKADLIKNRCVSKQTIMKVVDKFRTKYMEFDIKTGENIMELFQEITTLMIEKNLKPIAQTDTASKLATLQSLKQSAQLLQMEEQSKKTQSKGKGLEVPKISTPAKLPIKKKSSPIVHSDTKSKSIEPILENTPIKSSQMKKQRKRKQSKKK